MPDLERIERIKSEARAAIERADELINRVSDQTFKETVTAVRRRLGDIESFFLNHVEDVYPTNEHLWLTGAEHFLSMYIAELRRWEAVAASHGYKVKLIS